MPHYEFDSIELAEMSELLGLAYYEIDDPKRYQKIKDIMNYFKNREDKRKTILSILQKSPIRDSLDAVWNWIALAKERSEKIKKLPTEMFEENVIEEIRKEYLTKETIKRVKGQIDEKIEFEKRKTEQIAKQKEEKETFNKEIKSVEKAVDNSQLLEIKKNLEEIESINNILNQY